MSCKADIVLQFEVALPILLDAELVVAGRSEMQSIDNYKYEHLYGRLLKYLKDY